MEQKIIALYNPKSKAGKSKKRIQILIDEMKRRNKSLTLLESQYPGHLSEIVREHVASGVDQFISMGGDGTHFEVVNGLFPYFENKSMPNLWLYPLGTGNSFYREFADPRKIEIHQCFNQSFQSDVLKLEHDQGVTYFLNLLSFGFIADVAFDRNENFKSWGEIGYVLSVFKKLHTLKAVHFNLSFSDGHPDFNGKLTLISINNSKYTGGKMKIAPNALVDDGSLEVIYAKPMSRMDLIMTFPKIFKGTHVFHPKVHQLKCSEMIFHTKLSCKAMIDGETIRIVPKKISVLKKAIGIKV